MTPTKPESLALHAGYRADPTTNAVAVPIYQTTSYQFEDSAHAARLFELSEMGNIYTRVMNPTNDIFEQRMAAVEGGAAALAVSSGQAATTLSILNIAETGDNIVSSTDLYGGTWNLFANTLKTMGIEVRFVDPADPENFRRASDARTRAFYAETLPNPKLQVFPIREVADIAEDIGLPLIMDNTASPVICRPFDHGAHIIVHSATKYIGGHGNSIGGVIIDGGTFDWEQHAERFPMLNQPDPSYHGAVWTVATKELGPVAYIVKARCTLLRDLGTALSPFNTFNFIQGLETLSLRMREHCRNAQAVADYLSGDSRVAKVIYPGMTPDDRSERTEKYLTEGRGGLVGFEIKDATEETGARFIDSLQMIYHVANIGDTRTLAIHPASTTHQQLKPEERLATGVTPGYLRLSVGIEHIDDILADLDQALNAAVAGKAKAA
ncbi:bifunctional O-acetylhomoserine aminocarboxypropyltransferase/cysteine synthase [Pelagibius litoralis]|uniref:Bifunctional O-acetylhomoserine aminocarboxypropyltransferase/cysteine synthase n=1 Tax=Pelagibius litoralis TaxID=374515 RepID=A0A967F085_9PROT|nr:PLP-dependent transferase [Pelagibius litoralis]NIA70630.1 bifunctional O-acetylhomoserine aminocarboxypropyltransferase/cysteine synthase [Pelagibius litoralis]